MARFFHDWNRANATEALEHILHQLLVWRDAVVLLGIPQNTLQRYLGGAPMTPRDFRMIFMRAEDAPSTIARHLRLLGQQDAEVYVASRLVPQQPPLV